MRIVSSEIKKRPQEPVASMFGQNYHIPRAATNFQRLMHRKIRIHKMVIDAVLDTMFLRRKL